MFCKICSDLRRHVELAKHEYVVVVFVFVRIPMSSRVHSQSSIKCVLERGIVSRLNIDIGTLVIIIPRFTTVLLDKGNANYGNEIVMVPC